MIYPRKEVKTYGTGRVVEGTFRPGETAVVLDDLVTTGASKLEAIAPLEAAGLVVHDIVVLIDREQGGRDELAARGYRLHSVLRLSEIIEALHAAGRIGDEQADAVRTL
jgi:uridine monophosphate synthetase